MASSWLNSSPLRLYAQNGKDTVYVNATIQYAGGQTAIGIASILPITKARVDLMLLGNKGAIYHDSQVLSMITDIKSETMQAPESLNTAIKRSIQEGKPVELEV
jgi:hypothetical protein